MAKEKEDLVTILAGVEKQWVEDYKTPFEPVIFFDWAKEELKRRKIAFIANRLEFLGNPRNSNKDQSDFVNLIEVAIERYTRPTEQIRVEGKQTSDSGNVSGKGDKPTR